MLMAARARVLPILGSSISGPDRLFHFSASLLSARRCCFLLLVSDFTTFNDLAHLTITIYFESFFHL